MKMKKTIVILLSLLMALSLASCGSPEPDAGQSSQTPSQTESSDTSAESSDPVSDGAEELPPESGDEAPAFDTSWAGNEFEALLPELPFTGWTTEQESDQVYTMELGGLNTSPATNPPDSGEEDGADKNLLLAYLDSLSGYGFTVEETGTDYQWLATDAAGNTMEFQCAEGWCWITIQKAN